MKVLQINSVCGFGSTGRIATDIYDVLCNEGHESCIAYGRGKAPKGYNAIKIGNKGSFFLHIIKTRVLDRHGFGSKITTKKFIKQIEEYSPDVIHLHNLHGYYINIEILFEYLATLKTPVVWLLHDEWAFSGHGAHFELDKNNNIPSKNLKKSQKNDYPKSLFIDNSNKNFLKKELLFTRIKNMTIITPSNWLSKIARKSFLSKYDIKIINNGIDLTKFKPKNSNFKIINKLTNKTIILGVASIWNEKKGLYYFNELAELLDDSFKIVLVGIESKQIKQMHKNILLLPRTESINELAEIYTAADVFVNPTLEDNFPTTNIEALACGTPVITFDTGGSSEMLDAETGKVVKKGNISLLYQAIKNFNYNKDYQEICLAKSQNYNKKNIYKEYIKLYENINKST